MDYTRGWAWQQILLNRRLQYQRKAAQCQSQLDTPGGEEEGEAEDEDQLNVDRILLLEHKPVYTLGRGASEDHLTFLDEETKDGIEAKKRLSRKARGKDSCRLAVDRIQHVQSGISPLEEVNAMREYII
jgi:lipoate-protein ligase B